MTVLKPYAMGALLLAMTVGVISAARPGQNPPKTDLTGLWRTDTGALINIAHKGPSVAATYVGPKTCADGLGCPLSRSPEYFVRGSFDRARLTLSMMRCTHAPDMRDEGIADHWTTSTRIESVSNTAITGTYRTEFYRFETRDGKRINFRRDPAGDGETPFMLARANCREELDRLRLEIELRQETWRNQEEATAEVQSLYGEAIDGWQDAFVNTFKGQGFDSIVPPVLLAGPGVPERTPERTLTDSIAAFKAASTDPGKWLSLKWVGLADFLVNWTGLMSRGMSTINEIESISGALDKMRAADHSSFLKWFSAQMTVRALARQCPTTDAGATEPTRAAIDEEAADRARGAALARARSSAKAAEAAMERAGDAFNPLLTLLQRQEIGDPAKTVGQVLSAAEAAQFRAHVRTAMDAWITALGALRQTVIDVRAVPKFQPYSGSKGR